MRRSQPLDGLFLHLGRPRAGCLPRGWMQSAAVLMAEQKVNGSIVPFFTYFLVVRSCMVTRAVSAAWGIPFTRAAGLFQCDWLLCPWLFTCSFPLNQRSTRLRSRLRCAVRSVLRGEEKNEYILDALEGLSHYYD